MNCKQCGAKESPDLDIWTFEEIGKGDWDENQLKIFKANNPMCDDCIRKMFKKD